MYRRRAVVPALIGLVAVWLISPATASAATVRHVSTTGADTGDCTVSPCRTIQYAIGQSSSGDIVKIAHGTYSENVVVDRSLTLKGADAASTIIDGSAGGTVISIGAVSSSLDVTMARLTIQNGSAPAGGGISSVAGAGRTNDVLLAEVTIEDNVATGLPSGSASGGGVWNGSGSTLELLHSTVKHNVAAGNRSGYAGGVYNEGTLVVAGSAIVGNVAAGEPVFVAYGGGINNQGTLTVVRSTIAGNSARGGPGAIRCTPFPRPRCYRLPGGPGKGGGIQNAGVAVVDQTTVSANTAIGGLPNGSRSGGEGAGGGVEGGGTTTLVNSTVYGNSAMGGGGTSGIGFGGGIDATGSLTLKNATIAGNDASVGPGSGGGIALTVGSASLTNTILADNRVDAGGFGPDCLGTVTSAGHNLIGDDASCAGFSGSGDLVNADPLLGPLQKNGGPTRTTALLDGSPAIDTADDSVCATPPVDGVDQRGEPRPGGSHCDMGGFEVQ